MADKLFKEDAISTFRELNHSFEFRLSNTLDDIPTWDRPFIDIEGNIKIAAIADLKEWTMQLDVTKPLRLEDVNSREKKMAIINSVNETLTKTNQKIERIFFDDKLSPLAYTSGRHTHFLDNPERNKMFVPMTIGALGATMRRCSNTSSNLNGIEYFTYKMGDILIGGNYTWPLVPISILTVAFYLDDYVPVDPNDQEKHEEVTLSGFTFAFNYVFNMLSPACNIHDSNLEGVYRTLKGKNWIPHVPVKWNTKTIEELDTKDFEEVAFAAIIEIERTHDVISPTTMLTYIEDDNSMELANDYSPITPQIPTVDVPESISKAKEALARIQGTNPFERGYFLLSELIKDEGAGYTALGAEFPDEFYIQTKILIVDENFKIDTIVIRRASISCALFDCGTVVLIIKPKMIPERQLLAIKQRVITKFGIDCQIYCETDEKALKYIIKHKELANEGGAK